jgi:hypothetical protein
MRGPRSAVVPGQNHFIGDGLRSRTDGRRAAEVAVAVGVLNRMLDLGRPEYVRIA